MLMAPGGHLEIWPLVADALGSAQQTAVGAGQIAQPLTMATNHFRRARAGSGNLTARARVLNASNHFIYAEAQVEDNEGRQIASCGGHARIIALDPKPPRPPEQIEPIEEPRWATPDPWERSPADALPPNYWDGTNHTEIVSTAIGGGVGNGENGGAFHDPGAGSTLDRRNPRRGGPQQSSRGENGRLVQADGNATSECTANHA